MYDGVVDSPSWLLNPLALGNAIAGFQYVHGTYLAPDGDDPPTATPYGYESGEVEQLIADAKADCSAATLLPRIPGSDTIYITLPARYLPIFQPLLDLGDATGTSALIVPVIDLLVTCDANDHRNRLRQNRLQQADARHAASAAHLQPDQDRGGPR